MLRVNTVMTGHPGAPYFSSMYFEGVLGAEADAAQSAVRDFWGDLVGFIAGGLQIQVQTDVPRVDPVNGNILEMLGSPQTVVASTGNAPLPFSSQGLIRWRTGAFVGGKQIVGRTFIPNLANDAQLNALPSAGFTAAMQGAADALIAADVDANQFGVWSRKNGTFTPAATGSPWSNFAVLRSRRD